MSADIKEQEFFATIAKQLGRPMPTTPPPREEVGAPDFWTAQTPSKEDMVKEFIENAQRLTVRTLVVQDYSLLQAQIRFWLSELKAQSVICWGTPEMEEAGVAKACREAGSRVVVWNHRNDRTEMIRECAEVDVGITWADYAVANTSSLAHFCSPQKARAVSLLPPNHIAIVSIDRLVPRMGEVLKLISSGQQTASSVNFITGPSRTADIEYDLTLGVHGPGKLFVLILDK